jgi:hypothetical protein
MKLQLQLLALLVMCSCVAHSAPTSTNSAAASRILIIDPSSMSITAGKVTLTIGSLQRSNGVYLGNYRITVSPYFFKNEKGKLAIIVSDESLTKISHGKVAVIIGTATTDGKNGEIRHIDATATPADPDRGKLKLWFKGGNREMIFEPAYHLAGTGTPAVAVQTAETTPASNLPRSPVVSPHAAPEVAAKTP